MDGIVVYTHDGEDDMNIECQGVANAVIIDHGGDLFGYYWHFKNGSVSVSEGQIVTAGQQIAEIASSGCSTGPHIHFELRNHVWFGGDTYEPYTGTCNPGESMWQEQVGIERETYVQDHGITRLNSNTWPTYPHRYPNDRQFALTDTTLYYWQILHNLPASGSFMWRWWRPDGTLSTSSGNNYDYGEVLRTAIWWWSWDTTEMHTYPGTWHVQLEVNGVVILDMYPEVVANLDPTFNRPPSSVNLSISPSNPNSNEVINCSVLSSLTLDDPDRDIVRYRYLWKLNDIVVRDVISASMRDVLQRNIAVGGDVVTVHVTPSDGSLDGVTQSAMVTIGTGSNGACCLKSIGCQQIPPDTCATWGGIYHGTDVLCESNTCDDGEPLNACCVDVNCSLMTATDCSTSGGTYHADISSCATDPCDEGSEPNGACCVPSTECQQVPASTCSTLGGQFLGGGVVCEQNTCNPKVLRACCFGESCTLLTEADCNSQGGTYHDEFVSCAGNPCVGGDPTGACCLPAGSCIDLTPTVCGYVGGEHQGAGMLCGDGSVCTIIPCDADLNDDDFVGVNDLLMVIDQWGATNSLADINNDNIVDVSDLLIVVGEWGQCE